MDDRPIAGLRVSIVGTDGLISAMRSAIKARRGGQGCRPVVVTDVNGEAISLHARLADYREAFDRSDIRHADGAFVVLLSRFLPGLPIPERTATTDLIHDAAAAAEQAGASFYLLGGPEAVNRACAEQLGQRYPRLVIAGRRNGYFAPDELDRVVRDIEASDADVLWIGMGKPRETVLAVALRERLRCAWIVTCGGCFHFVAGDYRRAPVWMQRSGLEWLHRMVTGPSYLLHRYAITIPHALWLSARHAWPTRPRREPHPDAASAAAVPPLEVPFDDR